MVGGTAIAQINLLDAAALAKNHIQLNGWLSAIALAAQSEWCGACQTSGARNTLAALVNDRHAR